jgi:large subunit ribosomal protein L3
VRNLEVVAVDAERNKLWVRGGVPGGRGAVVKIRKAGE